MKQRWLDIAKKINSLTLRERGLVLLTAIAVTYLVWDFLFLGPVLSNGATLEKELIAIEQKNTSMVQEEKTLLLALSQDPDRDLKVQVANLDTRISELDEELAAMAVGLIPVDQLPVILQEVLDSNSNLTLVRLQTLPVETIRIQDSVGASDISPDGFPSQEGDNKNVYKHRVQLELSGSYLQLERYLKKLESLSWRFYWDELDFDLQQHPKANITLDVYTLSTDEGLFGV
ncbi:hypothetical protein [Aurantivibrio plasticivorans]